MHLTLYTLHYIPYIPYTIYILHLTLHPVYLIHLTLYTLYILKAKLKVKDAAMEIDHLANLCCMLMHLKKFTAEDWDDIEKQPQYT